MAYGHNRFCIILVREHHMSTQVKFHVSIELASDQSSHGCVRVARNIDPQGTYVRWIGMCNQQHTSLGTPQALASRTTLSPPPRSSAAIKMRRLDLQKKLPSEPWYPYNKTRQLDLHSRLFCEAWNEMPPTCPSCSLFDGTGTNPNVHFTLQQIV